jgi:hypothetical protein
LTRPTIPTITDEQLRAELDKLSSETLAFIDHCQYEVTGKWIRDTIESIMWDRYSTAGGSWPMSEPIPNGELGRPYKFQTIAYCSKASSPDDPAHQVARSLRVEINGVSYGRNVGFICSCGEQLRRSGPTRRRRVSHPGVEPSRVWPSVTIERVPYLVVCKKAPYPFDLDHGPLWAGEKCICGEQFPDLGDLRKGGTTFLERHYRLWDAQ